MKMALTAGLRAFAYYRHFGCGGRGSLALVTQVSIQVRQGPARKTSQSRNVLPALRGDIVVVSGWYLEKLESPQT